jgi:RNA-directed DNA polymerase
VTALEKLRAADSLDDVARLLGFTPSGLSYVLYRLPDPRKYVSFEIPKRNGGKRLIKAPEARLALLQRRLAKLLYECLDELGNVKPPARRSLAHEFERRRSIITNASLHKRRRYVLNLDLADFFPSINFGRVRGFFLKDKHFALQPKIATIISQIACHDNELPQGSPCSPVISNLIGHLLDSRLARFAKSHKCTYSRYADDITFSTSRKDFPPELAISLADGSGLWEIGAELRRRIEQSGFRVNDAKTRMQLRNSRQVTTGLMVNEKVNIRQEYWRTARQMCHEVFTKGTYYRTVPADLGGGSADVMPIKLDIMSLGPLEGMLAHINQVKERGDARNEAEKRKYPTAARMLYRRLLFYKNFVALDRPVVVPEGKTDSVYLRCAIRRLEEFHPRLGKATDGRFEIAIRLMNYSATAHEILELGSGTSQLHNLIEKYHRNVRSFDHRPLRFPVIVLVDNDDGGRKLFGLAKAKSGKEVSYRSAEQFYYLGLNLYLVKTPEKPEDPFMSCIEECFDDALLQTKLEGKSFDLNKDHEEVGKYGKAVFAARVVEPNVRTIDFSGFSPLLRRIVAAIDHHAASKRESLAEVG